MCVPFFFAGAEDMRVAKEMAQVHGFGPFLSCPILIVTQNPIISCKLSGGVVGTKGQWTKVIDRKNPCSREQGFFVGLDMI